MSPHKIDDSITRTSGRYAEALVQAQRRKSLRRKLLILGALDGMVVLMTAIALALALSAENPNLVAVVVTAVIAVLTIAGVSWWWIRTRGER